MSMKIGYALNFSNNNATSHDFSTFGLQQHRIPTQLLLRSSVLLPILFLINTDIEL